MGRKANKEKARKKVPIKLIDRLHSGKIVQPYRILEQMVKDHHPELREAKIVLAWHKGWKADADGRVKLGQCKKASDLDRELASWDFVIILNQEVWNRVSFTEAQMAALIDHELCHAMPSIDSNGEQKTDEAGRLVWRTRRHDVEEFQEIVARHGAWKDEIGRFAAAALQKADKPLLAGVKPAQNPKPEPKPPKVEPAKDAVKTAPKPVPPNGKGLLGNPAK